MAWTGDSEFALRFIGLWWSVLAVALLYRLACALGLSRAVALLGAVLLALSPYVIWHSQDARMYNMSLVLTLASTWLAVEAMRRPRWRYLSAYILVSWLALHTHYFAAFTLMAQNVFFIGEALLCADRCRRIWQWLGRFRPTPDPRYNSRPRESLFRTV
jgi:mannosyltransferase